MDFSKVTYCVNSHKRLTEMYHGRVSVVSVFFISIDRLRPLRCQVRKPTTESCRKVTMCNLVLFLKSFDFSGFVIVKATLQVC